LFVYCPIASVLSFSPPPPSRHHGPAGMGGDSREGERGGGQSQLAPRGEKMEGSGGNNPFFAGIYCRKPFTCNNCHLVVCDVP
jgi:hypothetical protein